MVDPAGDRILLPPAPHITRVRTWLYYLVPLGYTCVCGLWMLFPSLPEDIMSCLVMRILPVLLLLSTLAIGTRIILPPRKWPLVLALVVNLAVCASAGLVCWAVYAMEGFGGSEAWHRDGPPSGANMARFVGSNYPDSITRVVESGRAIKFNGDGEELVIFCFSRADLPRMKRLLSDGKDWKSGLPDDSSWRDQIEAHSPPDLKIFPTASPDDFIHIKIDHWQWTIIDTNRGISYRVTVST